MISAKAERDRRIADNYEFYKEKFVGKTDNEIREFAKCCFDLTTNIDLTERTKTSVLKTAFAAEEELKRRGVRGVYD